MRGRVNAPANGVLCRRYASQILDGVLDIGTRIGNGVALQVGKRLTDVNKSGFDSGDAKHPKTAVLVTLADETLRYQFLFAHMEFLNELAGWNLIAGSPL